MSADNPDKSVTQTVVSLYIFMSSGHDVDRIYCLSPLRSVDNNTNTKYT